MGALVFVLSFAAMEIFSWAVHKYVFHGILWRIHHSHHRPRGRFERNDVFSMLFGVPAAALIVSGAAAADWRLWAGLGITAYGVVYFLLHDLLIHRRIRNKWASRLPFVRRLVRGHKLHHKDLSKRGAGPYGLLWVPRNVYFNRRENA